MNLVLSNESGYQLPGESDADYEARRYREGAERFARLTEKDKQQVAEFLGVPINCLSGSFDDFLEAMRQTHCSNER